MHVMQGRKTTPLESHVHPSIWRALCLGDRLDILDSLLCTIMTHEHLFVSVSVLSRQTRSSSFLSSFKGFCKSRLGVVCLSVCLRPPPLPARSPKIEDVTCGKCAAGMEKGGKESGKDGRKEEWDSRRRRCHHRRQSCHICSSQLAVI